MGHEENQMKIDKFNLRIVRKGDGYGLGLTHTKDEPMVEFYDSRYPHTEFGQFVSRYYASTLLERKHNGLCLDGGSPGWSVSENDMNIARAWIASEVA